VTTRSAHLSPLRLHFQLSLDFLISRDSVMLVLGYKTLPLLHPRPQLGPTKGGCVGSTPGHRPTPRSVIGLHDAKAGSMHAESSFLSETTNAEKSSRITDPAWIRQERPRHSLRRGQSTYEFHYSKPICGRLLTCRAKDRRRSSDSASRNVFRSQSPEYRNGGS